MLTYSFENTGSDPMYVYLYKCIKNDISAGKIKAGEKLPSKRSFAKNLGISVITIEGAYGLLSDEGYIYSLPKKGFYVSDLKCPADAGETPGSRNVVLSSGGNAYIADFSSNQTDTEIFPFSIWAKAMRAVMLDKRDELMVNPPCGGIMELREAIAEYLLEFRGMNVRPSQIIIGAGTEYLYSLLIQLLGRKNVFGIENPGYHKAAKIYERTEIPYEYVDIDASGVMAGELDKKNITVIHTSPSHHFPTGIVMPVSRRYELLGWANAAPGRYIIEDDYDSELRMNGKPLPTLYGIDVSGKVIYMNTFTKTLCSTVRISYMVLPEGLAERFYKTLSFCSCTVSNFEQYTLERFMREGSFEKHINRLRRFYQGKRDALLGAMYGHPLNKFIRIQEKEAGVHFIMEVKTDRPEESVTAAARAGGVKLCPLSEYYHGQTPERDNIYVMNYSSLRQENIDAAVDIIYGAVR